MSFQRIPNLWFFSLSYC